MLTVEPEIIERYVRPGRVRLIFRDVLNHGERSERASEAAACAGRQGYFWHMHRLLFEAQDESWGAPRDQLVGQMIAFGARIEGLDQAAYGQCLAERATLAGLQAADREQRTRGVTVQPVFELAGRLYFGLPTVDQLSALLDEALR